jgi:hypothetical protein
MCLADGRLQPHARRRGRPHIDRPICNIRQLCVPCPLRGTSERVPDFEVLGTAGNATTAEETQSFHVGLRARRM